MSEQRPDDQQIRQILTQLHDELQHAQTLDDDERAMMRHLMADIQDMLKRSENAQTRGYPANQSLMARLEQSIDVLEMNHPALTVMIEKALDTLNLAGI
jgi:DNA repair ATPase RecN